VVVLEDLDIFATVADRHHGPNTDRESRLIMNARPRAALAIAAIDYYVKRSPWFAG